MDLQDLEKKPDSPKPGGKARTRIIIAAVAVVAIAAAFTGMKQGQETNRRIESLVSDLQKRAGAYTFAYPATGGQSDGYGKGSAGMDDVYWGADGYFEKVKDKKKFAAAVADAMETACVYADNEGEEKKFHSGGFEKACRMAAVLEYMDYENADIKAVMDGLMVQAAEAAKGDSWITSKNLFRTFAKYDSLPYYGNEEALTAAEIEAAFAEKWQKVKREMRTGKADLDGFLEDAVEVASQEPIEVPEYGTVKAAAAGAMAAASADMPVAEMYLEMEKMAPYDEVLAALEEYGEEAVFRSGQGGYYDGSRLKGNFYGDFRTQYVSGKVRRTGQEDDFTEQYLREHYDKPSKTYTYFKEERIGSLPTFYTDTERVFVYDGSVYAFAPYAIYTVDGSAVYDAEAARAAEQKHISLGEADLLIREIDEITARYLRLLAEYAPKYEYDIENSLVTVYLEAPQGTAEALAGDGQIPLGEDKWMTWENLREYLCQVCKEMSSAMMDIDDIRSAMWGNQNEMGVGFVLASDTDPDSALLSILNGEVVQDNSKNLPAKAAPEDSEPENAD